MPPAVATTFKLTEQDHADIKELGELLDPDYPLNKTATVKRAVRDRLKAERAKARKNSEKDSR